MLPQNSPTYRLNDAVKHHIQQSLYTVYGSDDEQVIKITK